MSCPCSCFFFSPLQTKVHVSLFWLITRCLKHENKLDQMFSPCSISLISILFSQLPFSHKALQKPFLKEKQSLDLSSRWKCFQPLSDERALSAQATLSDSAPSKDTKGFKLKLCSSRRSLCSAEAAAVPQPRPFFCLCLFQKCIQWELSLASQWPPPFCCSCFCWRSPSSSTANAKAVSVLYVCVRPCTLLVCLSVGSFIHRPSVTLLFHDESDICQARGILFKRY